MPFRGFRENTSHWARVGSGSTIYLPLDCSVPPDPFVRKVGDGIQDVAEDPLSFSKLQLSSDYPRRPGYGIRENRVFYGQTTYILCQISSWYCADMPLM
ncbi:hypothetical protein BDV29DRAFT_177688 [Aspergillus leporis]|uniref:Uncharacterized protein n=1 Tax=Aspergillus leporis TaxID=41062 RepID=A0A5N5WUR5_9EURO|nr:hypothetical protein BDV29DRAFT_177688 [Aspergillus leporis]